MLPFINGQQNCYNSSLVLTRPIRLATKQQFLNPTLNLSWLLFDFGGRSGSVGVAREALLAADWTHNATLQATPLATPQSRAESRSGILPPPVVQRGSGVSPLRAG